MIIWKANELVLALKDQLIEHNINSNSLIEEVVIDSRKTVQNGLFIAIRGEKNDGHNFLQQSLNNGCNIAIIDDAKFFDQTSSQKYLLVKDSFLALYKLAEFSRARSNAKIIAVTGSVGKTSTKEMLKSAFSAFGKTFATPGNLNNHFGVPLCLANFGAEYKFGIFEMGMNHLKEIEPLSQLARPHLAIITTVGPVHIEFFKNEQEIALAKSEIFAGLEPQGTALINRDNIHFDFIVDQFFAAKKSETSLEYRTFGESEKANYQLVHNVIESVNFSQITLRTNNSETVTYNLPTSNKAAIFNSSIIAASLDVLGLNIATGMKNLTDLGNNSGRGEIIEITIEGKNILIIDDSYNASLPSIKAGLEHAASLKKSLKKCRLVAALGDMLELGEKSFELHQRSVNFLSENSVDLAILVGLEMSKAAQNLTIANYQFNDSQMASEAIQDLLQDGDILYVKGSRGTKMEKIISKLTNKTNAH